MLIEPFAARKIQKYHAEHRGKIDDSSARAGLFTEADVRQHDLFSIAFIALHTQVRDLPQVYRFFEGAEGPLIAFDSAAFVRKLDAYFATLGFEDKFVRVLKRMVDYEGLKRGGLTRRAFRAAHHAPEPPNGHFRALEPGREQGPGGHEQPNRVRN